MTDDMLLRELGARLARVRLERNLTQAQLAMEAGISKRTVERIERGEAAAQLSGFLRLCRALELIERIDSLFRGLSFNRITGTAGRTDSLVQEIWRAFLIAMLLALVGEGLLSLPRRRVATPAIPALAEAAA
jgi:transcriptional regulator with XRE-family HTH domain